MSLPLDLFILLPVAVAVVALWLWHRALLPEFCATCGIEINPRYEGRGDCSFCRDGRDRATATGAYQVWSYLHRQGRAQGMRGSDLADFVDGRLYAPITADRLIGRDRLRRL